MILSNYRYNAIVLAVAHNEFKELDLELYKQDSGIIFDLKGVLEKSKSDYRL